VYMRHSQPQQVADFGLSKVLGVMSLLPGTTTLSGTPQYLAPEVNPSTLHLTLYTLHPAPYTLHLTPCTLHPAPYTLHLTRYTLHPTPSTQHAPEATPSTLHYPTPTPHPTTSAPHNAP
jgi:serine/threonine protein kinase